MIKEFVEAWETNKGNLEKYFRNNEQFRYDDYDKILELLIKKVINPYLVEKVESYPMSKGLSVKNITKIDDCEYQGTQIYIIPFNTYNPDIEDYIYTHNYYGSCSGCDTLLNISNYDEGLPTDEQVKGYMSIALHLLQKMKFLENEEV